jgi:hypothetical protein
VRPEREGRAEPDVVAWWNRLGLPGLIDVHTHFLPKPVMDAVWRYFDNAGEHYGMAWPIHYRGSDEERVQQLRSFGVRAFTALVYPHKPDMAAWLNAWAREFASNTPECLPCGTFFAEPSAPRYVREALDAGTRVFKVHVQVGGFDPRDAVLDEVWGLLAEAGTPVVVHCGSGPVPGAHTGPGPFAAVLAAHPRLTAVIAHAGMPEYHEHCDLVERYPNVHLDTTMVGTDFTNRFSPVPADVLARFGALGDRIVLGTDFPNIPYAYGQQLRALERFDLGEDWLRAVCWDNGARLLHLDAAELVRGAARLP